MVALRRIAYGWIACAVIVGGFACVGDDPTKSDPPGIDADGGGGDAGADGGGGGGGGDAGADGGGGGGDAGADGGGGDAGEGVLLQDGFESGMGCAGWIVESGLSAVETTADRRGGARSCLVCLRADLGILAKPLKISDPGTGTYEVRAYAKRIPGASAFQLTARITLSSGGTPTTEFPGATVNVPAQFTLVQAAVPSPDGGFDSMKLSFLARGADGECVYLDDVLLFRE